MNIYELRIRLTFCEEFAEKYIELVKAQVEVAALALKEKWGDEAVQDVMEHRDEYIEYALKSYFLQKK